MPAGAQCAQVIPNLGNGEWDAYVLNDAHVLDRAAPCVQAHVTPAEKQFADNQLADGFKNQRVIDADQFELTFSLPDSRPAGQLPERPPADQLDSQSQRRRLVLEHHRTGSPRQQDGQPAQPAQPARHALPGRRAADPGAGMPDPADRGGDRNQRSHHRLGGRGGVQGEQRPHLPAGPVSSHREHPRRKGHE